MDYKIAQASVTSDCTFSYFPRRVFATRMIKERELLIVRLRSSLEEIKTLRGTLPICASCKQIRDDIHEQWMRKQHPGLQIAY